MHHFRSAFVLLAVSAWTLLLMPVQLAALVARHRLAATLPRFYHRGNCTILGLKVEIVGAPADARPVLFAANHTSWMDIVILSAAIPGSFVAKSEVADWPIVGVLAKLQRSVFVARVRNRVAAHRDEIRERLEGGDLLILFPEGTSNDGNRVLPFKSAFFSVAEMPVRDKPLIVQPVSLAYVKVNNMPIGRHLRPFFAWYGDMALGPHLWRLLGIGPVTAVVEFHRPVTITEFGSRKALAAHCEAEVAAGVSRALSGRWAAQNPVLEAPQAAEPQLDSLGTNASFSG